MLFKYENAAAADTYCHHLLVRDVTTRQKEVALWPVLGWLSRRAGTEFIHRGDSNGTAEAAERLIWRLR